MQLLNIHSVFQGVYCILSGQYSENSRLNIKSVEWTENYGRLMVIISGLKCLKYSRFAADMITQSGKIPFGSCFFVINGIKFQHKRFSMICFLYYQCYIKPKLEINPVLRKSFVKKQHFS